MILTIAYPSRFDIHVNELLEFMPERQKPESIFR